MRYLSNGFKHQIAVSLVAVSLFIGVPARADSTKEFLMSCTYGALAGTLVGAATLAFTNQPGENLRNIARGASLGLYAGILLGMYVVYIVPGQIDPEAEDGAPQENPEDTGASYRKYSPVVYPLITERGVEGAAVGFTPFRF